MNSIKNIIRRILFIPAFFVGGEFKCTEGTWWFKFLIWLYGEDDAYPELDVVWPEKDENGKYKY